MLILSWEEENDVLTSTDGTKDERKSYASVFLVKCELIEEYTTAIYAVVQSCTYGTLQEQQ